MKTENDKRYIIARERIIGAFMVWVLFVLILGVIASTPAMGDIPSQAGDYVFMVVSPKNVTYGVQTLSRWGDSYESAEGRFQVFSIETGRMLWESKHLFDPRNGSLFLSDDGEHIAVIQSFVRKIQKEVINDEIPSGLLSRMLDTTVVRFYKRDKIISSYSLKDLSYDSSFLVVDGSSVVFHCFMDTELQYAWHIGEYPPREVLPTNPYVVLGFVVLSIGDKSIRVFDPTTGRYVGAIECTRDPTENTERLMKLLGGHRVIGGS